MAEQRPEHGAKRGRGAGTGHDGRHRARKRFGQHFLRDDHVIDRIVGLVGPVAGDRIIEIGPGEGVITVPLVDSGADVVAIEIDRDLAAALRRRFADRSNFRLIEADVLRVDFATLEPAACAPWRVVGNLPYNISTPLLERLLDAAARFSDMTLMLQREVAERLAAAPGSRDYGRLSVMAARRARIEHGFGVGPDSFSPPPKVDSAVIRVFPLAPAATDTMFERRLGELVRDAFSGRRKTIANSLRRFLVADTIAACGLDPRQRAETVAPHEFEALARASLACERPT